MYHKLYKGDCLEVMKDISDKSINLVLIDPPYNIGKDKWDKWKTVEDYVNFMGKVFLEIQRVLKDNGSFYFFHNDFLQIVELQNYINKNTNFIFKQFIVWNKRFNEAKNKGFLDGFIEVEELRNYQKMAEYCLFYTLTDENLENNYPKSRKYFDKVLKYINKTKASIIEEIGQRVDHAFRTKSSQWSLPTEDTYNKLITTYKINNMDDFKNYKMLNELYNKERYIFNNQKTSHSVMNYEIANKQGHITPKPTDLLQNLILHSSNENDIILDCFSGSNSTGIACLNTNRNYIGIEKDDTYFNLAKQRTKKHILDNNLQVNLYIDS